MNYFIIFFNSSIIIYSVFSMSYRYDIGSKFCLIFLSYRYNIKTFLSKFTVILFNFLGLRAIFALWISCRVVRWRICGKWPSCILLELVTSWWSGPTTCRQLSRIKFRRNLTCRFQWSEQKNYAYVFVVFYDKCSKNKKSCANKRRFRNPWSRHQNYRRPRCKYLYSCVRKWLD